METTRKVLEVIPWFHIPWYVTEDNMLSDKVKEGLMGYKESLEKITDFNNALMVLIFPSEEAMFQQEQRDFFGLVRLAKIKNFQDEEFIRKTREYLERYGWTKTFVVLPREPLSLNELIERVKNALKDKSLEEHELQEKQKEKNKKLGEELVNKLDDKKLISYIEWSKKFGWLLTVSVERALMACGRLIPFYKILAKRMNVPYSQWNHLTSEEIINVLEGKIEIKDLDERDKGYAYLMENGVAKMVFGEEGKEISDWIDNNVGVVDTDVSEFKGHPAFPGVVKGKARIAMLAKDSHKLEQGEILVCSMTSPDYVPAMKKAIAIVTDEGGLLSHASIVSRELGKPCIVGTKIGTKVLKDGDLVEVDANNGIVRKIK